MLVTFIRTTVKLSLIACLAVAPAFAQPNSKSPAADLSVLLNSVHSMKANFTQQIIDNHGKAIQLSVGHMAMQRPGKFRWDVTKPIPQLIIANEAKLWIYDRDLEQVTVRSLQQAAGESPALLLTNVNSTLEKDYSVKAMPSKTAGWNWFELTPKKPDNMFESIQMGFSKKQIHEMRLIDNLGHTTVIQYQNIQTNTSLATSEFTFKAPARVDVIDETQKK